MLTRTPKSKFGKFFKRGIAIAIAFEAVGFAASYFCYYKLNRDRDFRLYMRDSFPPVLELYYKAGEVFGNCNIRKQDSDIWSRTLK